MTVNEFKAWFEGYSEAIYNGAPTPEQWQRIQEKIKQLQTIDLPRPQWQGVKSQWQGGGLY